MNQLAPYVTPAIELSKNIFDQPKEDLLATVPEGQNKFHGYQDVKTLTANKEFSRDQVAFHFKPYLAKSLPKNIESDQAFHDYWNHAIPILHKLYTAIADHYGIPEKNDSGVGLRTVLNNDDRSVLSTRRYMNNPDGKFGLEAHSDTAILTLISSDQDGLEILKNDEWLRTSAHPYPRFYINIGDWMLFQIGNRFPFKAGMHRVPKVKPQDPCRHSLIIFLNPAWDEKLMTPSGQRASYKEYLFNRDFYTNKK
jgi:isopenicillin N synthase-like dioxygenase